MLILKDSNEETSPSMSAGVAAAGLRRVAREILKMAPNRRHKRRAMRANQNGSHVGADREGVEGDSTR